MKIIFSREDAYEQLTNYRIAEAVVNLCDDTHESCRGLNAEVIAKMILLQKGG